MMKMIHVNKTFFMIVNFNEHIDILCKKGFYPYEWADDINRKSCRITTEKLSSTPHKNKNP